jgi:hypothetical protein
VRAVRWPALLVIVALIVAAFLFADDEPERAAEGAPPQVVAGPVMARADAMSSLWFCNGGTAVDNGVADHRVVMSNTTAEPRSGTITVYASKPAAGARPAPVRKQWTLAPYARAEYRLAEVIGQAEYASATVEVAGGGVLVEHRVSGPLGFDRGPCTSSASNTWYVPIGTTSTFVQAGTTAPPPVARELLVFFNPFPGDAVIDAQFSTDTGRRDTTELFKGLVIPGGSVVGVDLAAAGVAVSSEVAASVTTRSGRVVVDRIQLFDDGQARRGLAASSGLGGPAPAWVFAAGRSGGGRQERLVVFNPNDAPSEVDVEVRPEDAARPVEPFQLTVQPHQHTQLDLQSQPRLAELVTAGGAYAVVVRTADGSAVVAERQVLVTPGSPGAGVGVSSGTSTAATRWYADVADADQPGSSLVLFNPNVESLAQVNLRILANGASVAPPASAALELAPGARKVVPLSDLGSGTFTVVVQSSAAVVAERELVGANDRAVAGAVPDSAALAPLELGGLLSLGS